MNTNPITTKQKAIEDMINDLLPKNIKQFSKIDRANLKGLGTCQRNLPSLYSSGYFETKYEFMLNPFVGGSTILEPFCSNIEKSKEGVLLVYFNLLHIWQNYNVKENVKRRFLVGAIISREKHIHYESPRIYLAEKKQPECRLITADTPLIPLYQSDYDRLMELRHFL